MTRPQLGFRVMVVVAIAALVPWWWTESPPRDRRGFSVATFAGGCFWCMEPAFESVPGVVYVVPGYTGGHTRDPGYDDVSLGATGHREAVEVLFDPKRVTYAQLLAIFWRNVDPENPDGQFCDFGEQYRSAIYVHDAAQRMAAEQSKAMLLRSRRWIRFATDILPATRFYVAERSHRDFYRKNPIRYHLYRHFCRRDERLAVLWRR